MLSALLAATVLYAAPAWKWVDANGTVHYSDRPMPGAELVELEFQVPPGSQPPANPTSQAAPVQTQGPTATDAASPAYTRLELVSPSAQETFWNLGGTLTVEVAVEPRLMAGHAVDLVYDGIRQNMNAVGTSLTLTEVFRGVHTVQAVIVDNRGGEILRSLPVEFMVQQTSLLNSNNRAN